MHIESIGSYQVLSEWGKNPAGSVLLAHDLASGREVTIQLLEPAASADAHASPPSLDRLRESVSGLLGFHHEGLVPVLDVGEQDGLLYIVTERPDGQSCDMFCGGEHSLPLADALSLVESAARGLHAAHGRGAVHGAVDPTMLYRVDEGRGTVGGFGLAAVGGDVLGKHSAPPRHAAPERLRREPVTPAADQFSLATVLYELTTGRPAFPGSDEATVAYRVVNEAVVDPAASDPPLPAPVAALLMRALDKQPRARFPDCGALADALRQAREQLPAAATTGSQSRLEFSGSGPLPPPAAGSTETVIPRAQPAAPPSHPVRPYVLGVMLIALLAFAGWMASRTFFEVGMQLVTYDARLVVEPSGVPVTIDGAPWQDSDGSGIVTFRGEEPFSVVRAGLECREIERRLEPADAGTEIVLVLDPISVMVPIDPAYDGARVQLNDGEAQSTPVDIQLDLCRDNRVTLSAPGRRAAGIEIATGATPLEARTKINAIELDPIPMGELVFPDVPGVNLVYYLDGERVSDSTRSMRLQEGEYRLRYKNDFHWLDVTETVKVEGDATLTPAVAPRFGELTVQAFPSNCKVFLRRPGGKWRFLDETPAQRRLATGELEVKVQLNPTGETRVERVNLREGDNPPVRVSFAR